jgi:hypothetical protein
MQWVVCIQPAQYQAGGIRLVISVGFNNFPVQECLLHLWDSNASPNTDYIGMSGKAIEFLTHMGTNEAQAGWWSHFC